MTSVIGDSTEVRELSKKLICVVQDIITLNSQNKNLLNDLGRLSKDRSLETARQAVYEVAEPILAGLDDVKETCSKLGKYADFLASMENEGGSGLGGQTGDNGAGSSPHGSSSPVAHKPVNTTSTQVANREFSHEEKLNWVSSMVPGCDPAEAGQIVASMEAYSGADFSRIHWDEDGTQPETGDILKVFDAGKAPVYKGNLYRGLKFNSYHEAMKVLMAGGGTWSEPGITSFSTDRNTAENSFASHSGEEWGILFTCTENKTAIPFQHMSVCSWESEVLSPGGHRNNGWNIDFDSLVVDMDKHMIYVDINEK